MLCVSSGDRAAERKSNYNTFPYASPPSPACCHRRTYWEQKAKTAREEYKKIRARKFPECSPTLQRLPSRDSRAPAARLQLFFLRIFTRWILNITREVKSLVLVYRNRGNGTRVWVHTGGRTKGLMNKDAHETNFVFCSSFFYFTSSSPICRA